MYRNHWNLHSRPFENNFDGRYLYDAAAFQAAELKLRYAIDSRLGAALLTGPSGTGKTLMTHTLQNTLPETATPFVRIGYPQFSPRELWAYLAAELSPGESTPPADAGLDHLARQIEHALSAHAAEGRSPIVVVDGADQIERLAVFQSLERLVEPLAGGRRNVTLLLVGEPSLVPRLRRAGALAERIAVSCQLSAFSQEETCEYIEHRLHMAGANRAIFDDGALQAVFELSAGVPLRINHLCELSLLVGFAEQATSVSAEQVNAVAEELVSLAA